MKPVMLIAIALTVTAPAAVRAAGSDDAVVAVRVSHHDLNLSSQRDAEILLRRLDNAATEACGASRFSLREYREAVRRSPCHEAATSRAVATLGAPTVTSLYNNRALAIAHN